MDWVLIAVVIAGFAVGFTAGVSPTPTGGTLSAAVVAFVAGVVGGVSRTTKLSGSEAQGGGFLVVVFIVTMLVIYVITNVMRRKRMFVWMGFSK